MSEYGQPDIAAALRAAGYDVPAGFVFGQGGQVPEIQVSGGYAPLPTWNIYDNSLDTNNSLSGRVRSQDVNNIEIFENSNAGNNYLNNISIGNSRSSVPTGGWLNTINISGANQTAASQGTSGVSGNSAGEKTTENRGKNTDTAGNLNNISAGNNRNSTPTGGWLNTINVSGANQTAASQGASNTAGNTAKTAQHRFETTTERSGRKTNTYYIGSTRVTYAEWAKDATPAEKESAKKAIS